MLIMKVTLEDVSNKASSNLAQKDIDGLMGDYPIFGASGYIGNVDFYHQEREYIAVVKDGAGVGRTMYLPAKSSVIGTLQYILPKDNIVPRYLYYAVRNMKLERYYMGAAIPHIYYKDYKKEIFEFESVLNNSDLTSEDFVKIISAYNEKYGSFIQDVEDDFSGKKQDTIMNKIADELNLNIKYIELDENLSLTLIRLYL